MEKTLDRHIEEFQSEIRFILNNSQMVMGGSLILKLHGLNMGNWVPGDLDVIVFNPDSKAFDYIEGNLDPADNYNVPDEEIHSYGVTRKDMTLNVIISKEVPPVNPLQYCYQDTPFTQMYIPVNPINRIIEAKASYSVGKKDQFLRKKDMLHLQALKNLNFNF